MVASKNKKHQTKPPNPTEWGNQSANTTHSQTGLKEENNLQRAQDIYQAKLMVKPIHF